MGEYGLGIDFGTRYTAAAITAGGAVEAVRLGGRRAEIPSSAFLREDGEVLFGEAARRRGESTPDRLVDDLRARLIDPEPVRIGPASIPGPVLTGQFLERVVATASRGRSGRLRHVVLTHPAAWGDDELEALREAARLADLPAVTLVGEPAAAAARAQPGAVVAVYDLGATFQATVLRRTGTGAEILAAEGVAGVDFDRMVFEQVRAGLPAGSAEPADAGLARLRRECAEAVESLSFDTEAEIAVDLPGLHTRVRFHRPELEELVSPALAETVAALRRAFEAADVRPEDADAVVLAGGSARIPLVGALVSAAIGRPVPPGEQPELAVAMGAARLSLPGADQAVSVAFPAVPARYGPAADPATDPISPASAPAGGSPSAPAQLVPSAAVGGRPAVPAGGLPALVRPAVDDRTVRQFAATPAVRAGHPGTGEDEPTRRVRIELAPADPPTRPDTARRRGRIWTYRWPIAVALAGLVVAAAVTGAAMRPRANPSGYGPSVSAAPATASAALLWKVPAGLGSTEPPAVAGDRIVLASADGLVRGYRRDDGVLAWSAGIGAGARVATDVPGDRAYAVTAGGQVVALDPTDGQITWQRSTSTHFDARPAVGDGRVYAGGRDGVLYAYEVDGGHRRWRVWADGRISLGPALVGTVAVFAADDGRLYGTDRYGSPLWRPSVGPAVASPVAAAGTACLPLRDGSVRCARIGDGTLLPRITRPGASLTAVAGGEGLVFAAGTDGSVGAWDPISGDPRWSYRPPSGPAGAGHLLIRTGEIDVAYPGGHLVGLDAMTGTERWQYSTGDRLDTAPAGDELGIFVLGGSGVLYALRPPGVAAALGSSPTATSPPGVRPGPPPPTHHRVSPSVPPSVPSGPPSEPHSDPPPVDGSPSAPPSRGAG